MTSVRLPLHWAFLRSLVSFCLLDLFLSFFSSDLISFFLAFSLVLTRVFFSLVIFAASLIPLLLHLMHSKVYEHLELCGNQK